MINLINKPNFQLETLNQKHSCPNCGSQGLQIFYEVRNVPVHSCLMMSSKEEALKLSLWRCRVGFLSRMWFYY